MVNNVGCIKVFQRITDDNNGSEDIYLYIYCEKLTYIVISILWVHKISKFRSVYTLIYSISIYKSVYEKWKPMSS